MILYSQKDPAFANTLLPKSRLTMQQAGCAVCLVGTAGQASDIVALLKTKGAFVDGGYLVFKVLAEALGMKYLGASKKAPKGWSGAVTNHYAAYGVPEHFFLVNGNMMIDSLARPAVIEPLKYKIKEYRLFEGMKLPAAIRQELAKKEKAAKKASKDRKIALTKEIRKLRRIIEAE